MTVCYPPRITSRCPFCKGLYKDWVYASWNTFGAKFYSDGIFIGPMTPTHHFAYKCKFCNKYFLARDLIELSYPEKLFYNDPKNDNLPEVAYASSYAIDESDYVEIENMLANGFFYPENATEDYKKESNLIACINLWRAYNNSRDKISDDKYIDNCLKILSLSSMNDDNKIIMCAEINRNIGRFDKCKELLEKVSDKERYNKVISKIIDACDKKIKTTILINDK